MNLGQIVQLFWAGSNIVGPVTVAVFRIVGQLAAWLNSYQPGSWLVFDWINLWEALSHMLQVWRTEVRKDGIKQKTEYRKIEGVREDLGFINALDA